MWCEHCNQHYDDEFETCLVCGAKLQHYSPILTQEERAVLDLFQEQEDQELAEHRAPEEIMPELLVTVAGEEEARRLAALLEGLKVPCLCRPSQTENLALEDEAFAEEDETLAQVALPEELEQETLYDLLVPKMLVRKALRILHEDEALQEERQAALAKEQEQKVAWSDLQEEEEKPDKATRKWLGWFGKK